MSIKLSELLTAGSVVSSRDEYGTLYVLQGNRVNIFDVDGHDFETNEPILVSARTRLDPTFDCNKATLQEAIAYVNTCKEEE